MIQLGFAELHTIRAWQGMQSLSGEIEDDYIESVTTAPIPAKEIVEVPSSSVTSELEN